MISNWVLLAVLAGLASNFFGFVSRFALKDENDDPNSWAFLFEFIRLIIFSVLAGIIILKEKQDILKKLIGSIITIIGVILLT